MHFLRLAKLNLVNLLNLVFIDGWVPEKWEVIHIYQDLSMDLELKGMVLCGKGRFVTDQLSSEYFVQDSLNC